MVKRVSSRKEKYNFKANRSFKGAQAIQAVQTNMIIHKSTYWTTIWCLSDLSYDFVVINVFLRVFVKANY